MNRRNFLTSLSVVSVSVLITGCEHVVDLVGVPLSINTEARLIDTVQSYLEAKFGTQVQFAFNGSLQGNYLTKFKGVVGDYRYYIKLTRSGGWIYQLGAMATVTFNYRQHGLRILRGALPATLPNPLPENYSNSSIVEVFRSDPYRKLLATN